MPIETAGQEKSKRPNKLKRPLKNACKFVRVEVVLSNFVRVQPNFVRVQPILCVFKLGGKLCALDLPQIMVSPK